MNNKKTLAVSVLFSLILFILHKYALDYHLYMKFWFYDIVMHFLGGLSIASLLHSIASVFNLSKIKNSLVIVVLTFIVGFAWEVFEVYFNIAGHPFGSMAYKIDTVKDLIMDIIGAFVLWSFIRNKNK